MPLYFSTFGPVEKIKNSHAPARKTLAGAWYSKSKQEMSVENQPWNAPVAVQLMPVSSLSREQV